MAFVRLIFSLAFVLGLVFLVRYLYSSRAPSLMPRRRLQVEEHATLGPGRGLYVVRYNSRRLLLGVSSQSVTVLTEEQVAPEETFEHHLQNAQTQRQLQLEHLLQRVDGLLTRLRSGGRR